MAETARFANHFLLTAVLLVAVNLAGCSKSTDETPPSSTVPPKPVGNAPSKEDSAAADAVLLRWQFTKDTTYRWSVTLTMRMEAPQGDRLVKGGTDITLDFDVLALDATAENAELQFSIVRVRMDSDLPDMEFKYDSADEAAIDEDDILAAMAAESYRPLLDVKMTARVNSRGVVEDLQVDPELKQTFETTRSLRATAVLLEPAGLNSIFLGGLIPVPQDTVSIGDGWSETFTSPAASPFGSFKMEFSPRYAGAVEVDGKSLEKFDVDVGMTFDEPSIIQVKFAGQKSTGVLYFDRKAKAVQRCEWTVDSELSFNDGEAKGRMILGAKARFGPKKASDDLGAEVRSQDQSPQLPEAVGEVPKSIGPPAPKDQSKLEAALRKFIFPKEDLPNGCKQEVQNLTTSRQFIDQIVKRFFNETIQAKPIQMVLYSVYKEQDELGVFAMSFDNKANAEDAHIKLSKAFENQKQKFVLARDDTVVVCLWRDLGTTDACFGTFKTFVEKQTMKKSTDKP